jgi:hypothetical protein
MLRERGVVRAEEAWSADPGRRAAAQRGAAHADAARSADALHARNIDGKAFSAARPDRGYPDERADRGDRGDDRAGPRDSG